METPPAVTLRQVGLLFLPEEMPPIQTHLESKAPNAFVAKHDCKHRLI